ncbi:MAG TPA: 3'-5' exonuclease [Cyclobacteriaceae bacterium]|nr:3'-5' exonuclease [Cyclobacteriaceae bacterium]
MDNNLSDILFLDIETVACVPDYTALDERLKVQWARKATYLKKDEAQTDADLFNERAGIYAEFGKVIVIGLARLKAKEGSKDYVLNTKAIYGHDEKEVLLEFKRWLEKSGNQLRLCAHNGKEFDFPYLCRRMLVNDIALPYVLDISGKKPWEITHLDTMDMWKFGDYKHYTALDLLAAIFNIPSSKTDIDGSMVNKVYHHENNLEKIAQYCINDTVVLAQLYLRMKGHALIKADNIIQHS